MLRWSIIRCWLREQARALALERAWQQLAATGVERDQVMESQVDEYIIADQHGSGLD